MEDLVLSEEIRVLFKTEEDICCVYWIYREGYVDIEKEGYIGITSSPINRYKQHQTLQGKGHSAKYREYVPLSDTKFKLILIADRDACLDVEYKLRPTYNIGWNVAIGGVRPTLKHGLTGSYVFDTYRRFKGKATRGNLPFGWDCLEDFVTWFSLNNPDNEAMFRIEREKGYTPSNMFIPEDENYPCSHYAKKFEFSGSMYTLKQLSSLSGVTDHTLRARLKKGIPIEEAMKLKLEVVPLGKGETFVKKEKGYKLPIPEHDKVRAVELSENGKLSTPEISDTLCIPLHSLRYYFSITGVKEPVKVLRGLGDKPVKVPVGGVTTQKNIDQFIEYAEKGYLLPEIIELTGLSSYRCKYIRKLIGWSEDCVVGREVLCDDGTTITVSGRNAISEKDAECILRLKHEGKSDTFVAKELGKGRWYVSYWKKELKWVKGNKKSVSNS